MDPNRDADSIDDLSALAWVHDELRRSLEAAHKALRRYLREAESTRGSDVDAVDPAVLRSARQQIHQGVGALELVGLPAAAQMLRASEAAVHRYAAKAYRLDPMAVETIERASFALLDYVARRLAGKPVPAVAMFPQYRAVQELAGAERVHPADLWAVDWRWRELEAEAGVVPRAADVQARAEFEGQLLQLMRGPAQPAAERSSGLFASLSAGAADASTRTMWQLAAAFFEAQASGLIHGDVYSKRVASRLLAQLRLSERAAEASSGAGPGRGADMSDRLAQDLLFFCAQAGAPGEKAPRLAAVRRQYGLVESEPVDYEAPRLGRFDPAWIVQARKRIGGAKDAWSAVAGGEMHRMSGLAEQFSLVADSVERLHDGAARLAQALREAATQTVRGTQAPSPELAMEVATALLSVEATLEDAEFDHPEQGHRLDRLAARIEHALQGHSAGPLEAWMEDLYRRVSDRQTMGSVVQELRASLSESEKAIDQFFRHPDDTNALIPVPQQLATMRGVLSVLGMEQGAQVVLRMRDEIDALIAGGLDPRRAARDGRFERLAGNLGALGFLIDMLSVQPQLAKSLFVFDTREGTLNPVMGRQITPSGFSAFEALPTPAATMQPRLIEQALSLAVSASTHSVSVEQVSQDLERMSLDAELADQPALAASVSQARDALGQAVHPEAVHAAREQIAEVLTDFVATASEAVGLEPEVRQAREAAVGPGGPATTGLEEDDEMREVFLEEAREVLQGAHEAVALLSDQPEDVSALTTVRRAFHTLKGSSRMVGLDAFGEGAWACEQLYNARLADRPRAEPALLGFTLQALTYLGDWVEAIAARRDDGHDASALRRSADALRLEERAEPLHLPDTQPAWDEAGAPPAVALPPIELDLRVLDLPDGAAGDSAVSEVGPVPEDLAEPTAAAPDAEDWSERTLPLPLLDDPVDAPVQVPEPVHLDLLLDVGEAPPTAAAPVEVDEPPDEAVKIIGPLRVPIPLFNIYLNEADELSRRLVTEVAEWAMELYRGPGEAAIALAHSLAGSSATVGYADLSQLARGIEHGLQRIESIGRGTRDEAQLFTDAAEDVRRLLHQFAAGFVKSPSPELLERLAAHEIDSARRLDAMSTGAVADPDLVSSFDDLAEARLDEEGVHIESFEIPTGSVVFEPEPALSDQAPAPALAPQADAAPLAPATAPALTVYAGLAAEASPFGLAPLKTLADAPTSILSTAPVRGDDYDDDIDAVDAVDAELFPIFEEEGQELLPQLSSRLHDWLQRPADVAAAAACMRTLHTLKGGARLAGAMRLGEMAHRLETAIERVLADDGGATAPLIEPLQARADNLLLVFEALRRRDAQAYAEQVQAVEASAQPAAAVGVEAAPPDEPAGDVPTGAAAFAPDLPEAGQAADAAPAARAGAEPSDPHAMDWSAFMQGAAASRGPAADADRRAANRPGAGGAGVVRVRAPLLERLVNQAGEVSIRRARIETEVAQVRGSLGDLGDNLERLRHQLREIELQAETQIASRMEAAKVRAQDFDPLEMDRFTRFQELTRMMAESVNDVATVQRTLQRTLQSTEDELAAQARLTRELQDDLLRTRMVEFEGLSDRLYRVVRQAAKETGKQVRLDIVGGSIEIDRGVLERMTGSFEHLLRNCVTHGVESPEQRERAGKPATGTITVGVTHEGNEVGVEFRDDGAGLDLVAIRSRGVAMGLIDPARHYGDAELANLIFTAGFSTAEQVTELAGRGIGMDVVRSEVVAMGGRVETATASGEGTSFKLVMPLTTAVTQVVMLRCASVTVAVPSTLVEIVRRSTPADIEAAYDSGSYRLGERSVPFYWLGALLQSSPRGLAATGRALPVVMVRSAQQSVALHVDEVLGNHEVVVKNLGPQLSRLPGLVGITLLASGAVTLIYNPVALATLYGAAAHAYTRDAALMPQAAPTAAAMPDTPLVMVVDDSLTVRRVTQRLLLREGYRVVLAKDGLEALERLAQERPAVLLSDIEMPRMDGFDLVRNVRADARLADLPIVMITSRIAQKHRDYAAELGVDHYLGKPYSEEDLLALVSRYTSAAALA